MLLALCAVAFTTSSHAQTEAARTELQAAVQEANASLINGPKKIAIFDEASFALPADAAFVPAAAATRYMRALGNRVDESSLIGVIVPHSEHAQWLAILSFEKAGYVRDDDARNWNADDILKSLREGTEEANAGRRERQLPELEVTGWAEPPAYDANTHRLVWSAIVRRKGTDADQEDAVNYRTIALGRNGYVSLTMVTQRSALAADKPAANALLADIGYGDGKRYADFNSSTDHVAEYGLAALVAGVAVKKLGLLAIIAAFAVKFFKIGLVAVIGFGAAFKRFFKRKPKATVAPTPAVYQQAVESEPTTLPAPSAQDDSTPASTDHSEHPR
ncbi:DUF2167 domain-containing protein [Paraburkholderia jirisanensis]